MDKSIVRAVDRDGVEFFTVKETGESGMSVSGLAKVCGTSKQSVSGLLKSLIVKSFEAEKRGGIVRVIPMEQCIKVLYHFYNKGFCTKDGCKIINAPFFEPGQKGANRLTEKAIQKALQKEIGGDVEVPTEVGRIDLLTPTELIEIKKIGAWKGAVGQVIVYGQMYPSHSKRIHLFGSAHSSFKSLIVRSCRELGIAVTFAS